jgi:putative ABC transport system ATP-binding protein
MLDAFNAGNILWQGKTLTSDEIPTYRSQAIYLPQRARMFTGTIGENLQRPFSLAAHRHRKYSQERIVSFLELLDRDDRFLNLDAENLSGGEAQIVALLRAIQLDPTILLLDEPTASLDGETTQQIERLVMDWISTERTRRAFVWVTHDATQADRVANRRLRFRDGRLMEPEVTR